MTRKIGPYTIDSIETGKFGLDGGAMFGIVPRPLWSKKTEPDDQNRIDMRAKSLLVRDNKRTILIETGIGDWWEDKYNQIYKIDHSVYSIEKGLNDHNLDVGDITDVVFTHLHFDHSGGATKIGDDGNMALCFPNATYHVQKKQAEWAKKPNFKDAGSFMQSNLAPILDSNKLNLIDGEIELFENFKLKVTDGHTFSQQHPIIYDDSLTLCHAADTIPMSFHIRAPWIMAFDLHPLKTIEEKRWITSQAIEHHWILFFGHCSKISAANVVEGEKGPELMPVTI